MRTSGFLKTTEGSKYLLCDGSEIPSSYPKLRSLMTHTPDLKDRVPQGAGAYAINTKIEAALPNITGWIETHYAAITTSGAFFQQRGTYLYFPTADSKYYNRAGFDASRCSPIYRDNCTTVQPPALAVAFYIKAK